MSRAHERSGMRRAQWRRASCVRSWQVVQKRSQHGRSVPVNLGAWRTPLRSGRARRAGFARDAQRHFIWVEDEPVPVGAAAAAGLARAHDSVANLPPACLAQDRSDGAVAVLSFLVDGHVADLYHAREHIICGEIRWDCRQRVGPLLVSYQLHRHPALSQPPAAASAHDSPHVIDRELVGARRTVSVEVHVVPSSQYLGAGPGGCTAPAQLLRQHQPFDVLVIIALGLGDLLPSRRPPVSLAIVDAILWIERRVPANRMDAPRGRISRAASATRASSNSTAATTSAAAAAAIAPAMLAASAAGGETVRPGAGCGTGAAAVASWLLIAGFGGGHFASPSPRHRRSQRHRAHRQIHRARVLRAARAAHGHVHVDHGENPRDRAAGGAGRGAQYARVAARVGGDRIEEAGARRGRGTCGRMPPPPARGGRPARTPCGGRARLARCAQTTHHKNDFGNISIRNPPENILSRPRANVSMRSGRQDGATRRARHARQHGAPGPHRARLCARSGVRRAGTRPARGRSARTSIARRTLTLAFTRASSPARDAQLSQHFSRAVPAAGVRQGRWRRWWWHRRQWRG